MYIQIARAALLVGIVLYSSHSAACSPPSEPRASMTSFERSIGPNRFWAVVIGQEPVAAEGGQTLVGLRVRLLGTHPSQSALVKEFTVVEASTRADCKRTQRSLSTSEYPEGTELHLGTHDWLAVSVLDVGYQQAVQCPHATFLPSDAVVKKWGGGFRVDSPDDLPPKYSGCRYSWISVGRQDDPFVKYEASFFEKGELMWRAGFRNLCVYENGQVNTEKSLKPQYCKVPNRAR